MNDRSSNREDARAARMRLVRRMCGIASLAAALFPTEAKAAPPVRGGAGLYVSFVFGEQLGVGYGLEGQFMVTAHGFDQTLSDPPRGAGGIFQVGGINASTLRFVGALQAGGELGKPNNPALLGELGIAGHLGRGAGIGLHTGLTVDIPAPSSDCGFEIGNFLSLNAFARAEWFLKEYSLGLGMRSLAPFPWTSPAVLTGVGCTGRPMRGEHDVIAPVAALESRVLHGAPPSEVDAWLGAMWARDAATEALSVPAFLQLAEELLATGAPEALVSAALDAAMDEIRHARVCALMASRWSGKAVVPALPETPKRPALEGRGALVRLAVESFVDGSVGEGRAALRAQMSGEACEDAASRSALLMIARDEHAHAELGWSILAFALSRGGSDVRDAVVAAAGAPFEDATTESAPAGVERLGGPPTDRGRSPMWPRAERAFMRRARERLDRLV